MASVISWDTENGEFFVPFESLDIRECDRYAYDSDYDIVVPFGFSSGIEEDRLQDLLRRYWFIYATKEMKERRFKWEEEHGIKVHVI